MGRKDPKNYKQDQDLIDAYEEGGRAIGRMILHDPEQEEYLWGLFDGIKLWPKWYLYGFRCLYRDENPDEARRAIARRYRRKKSKKGHLVHWEQEREQATRLTAHPNNE